MEDPVIDLRSILGLLKRQFRLIVVATVLGVILAGVAAYSLTPIYTATALVLVDPSRKNLLDPNQLGGSMTDNARLDSEVELVKSDNVLMRVVQDLNLIEQVAAATPGLRTQLMMMLRLAEPVVQTPDDLVNQALGGVRNAVSVQRRGLTYLIAVQARSPVPATAASLANAVVKAYIADQLQSKVDSLLTSRDVLDARTAQARAAIVESEGSFDRFVSENIADIVQDTGRTDLAAAQKQIDALIAQRDSNLTLADAVERNIASGDFDAVLASLQSDALREIENQRTALNAQLAGGAETAQVASIQAELAALDTRLRTAATGEVAALRNSVADSQSEETTLRQKLRTEVLDSPLSANTLTQLYELQQGATIARSQYENLLARARDIETQADLQVADSRVVSPALTPQSPSFPNRPLIIMIAGLLSLGVGIGLALLYENLIGGFVSQEQMEAVLRRPVAASVPLQRTKDGASPSNLMTTAPLSIFSESIRRIRAAIEQSARQSPPAEDGSGIVVMVTSSSPGDGKTTLALSIARSFAISGRATLLIDCDLRKPSIHRQLGMEPSEGLLEYLGAEEDQRNLAHIIGPDKLTNTMIIVGSRRSHLPTDQLLVGGQFKSLISAARRSFDVVVLDTPPIEPVVDGLYVASFADVIVLVTRWANTPQTMVRKALAQFQAAKRPETDVLLVLNQQHENLNAQKRKYGEYYTEPT